MKHTEWNIDDSLEQHISKTLSFQVVCQCVSSRSFIDVRSVLLVTFPVLLEGYYHKDSLSLDTTINLYNSNSIEVAMKVVAFQVFVSLVIDRSEEDYFTFFKCATTNNWLCKDKDAVRAFSHFQSHNITFVSAVLIRA